MQITPDEIRKDLMEIRYYYSRKTAIDASGLPNRITEKVKRYNTARRIAEPRMFDLYVCLYLRNQTQAGTAVELGWSEVYVQKLHKKLVLFFKAQFDKEV